MAIPRDPNRKSPANASWEKFCGKNLWSLMVSSAHALAIGASCSINAHF